MCQLETEGDISSDQKASLHLTQQQHSLAYSFLPAGIFDIPADLSALFKLQLLRLDNCKGIKQIPACLSSLTSLRELSLNETAGLIHVDSIRNLKLEKLSLRWASGTCTAWLATLQSPVWPALLMFSQLPFQMYAEITA